ncbi:MAG: DNA repair protein RecN [Anaerolineaceae bacterium]
MLKELRIQNFAIIQQLDLELSSGLTTFTGETGAGKSIILDAIEVLVGGKTDTTQIRAGEERALLEATFSLQDRDGSSILEVLNREELLDDPDEMTIAREIRREGRSVARINGRSVSSTLLREIGGYLVDIHGQSEHLSLLNTRRHLELLDRYAGSEEALSAYQKEYHILLNQRRELAALRQNERDALQRSDLLRFQVQEIESARLQPDEEEPLRQERDRLANAETLAALAQESLVLLDEGSDDVPALSDGLGQVVEKLTALARIDKTLAQYAATVRDMDEELADLIRNLRDYVDQIEYNPRRLEQVDDRLDLIQSLKRKYGATIQAVMAFGVDAKNKLELIETAGERIAELEEQELAQVQKLAERAVMLSQSRKAAIQQMQASIETELNDLSMAGARFQVEVSYEENESHGLTMPDGKTLKFDENGIDQVQFLIAPNPGEGLKPMVKIASGGETSRLMLALKNVLVKADSVPTLIFDEIDQGISGRVGSMVGEKLWRLGRQHQVFCVTHLPQLAAFGDQHYSVRKEVDEGRTTTRVDILDDASRKMELALLLGNTSEAGLAAAGEALNKARQRSLELLKTK